MKIYVTRRPVGIKRLEALKQAAEDSGAFTIGSCIVRQEFSVI
ncbi:hypothetical protein [Salimicrobium album]|nr:hypothetical protein [Salimicrobium album]